MVIKLNLSGYQRRGRKLIPSSLPNLLGTPYMMEHLVKEIYGLHPKNIKTIGVYKETEGGIKGNLSDSGRIRVRIHLTDGNFREHAWFVKIMPQNSKNAGFNIFNNEIAFYQQIIPEMREFVKNEGLADIVPEFDIPEILYAKADDTGAIIVLKDIIADGYRHERDENGDRFLSVEHAIAAVCSLAKLHAVSVAMQIKQNRDLSKSHPTLAESGMLWAQAEMTERLAIMKDSYCELLQKSPELDSPTLLRKFRQSFDSEERLVDLCQKRCESTSNNTRSLQHGDFHFNNLMFKQENGATKVKVVDWQLTYTGKKTGDLSYLLMSSLSPENRETYEDVIKSEYFNAYHSTLQTLTNRSVERRGMDLEYNDSLPLSFFLSCGNIMNADLQDRSVQFSYDMCKEAAMKEII